jgi:hypothetical protein
MNKIASAVAAAISLAGVALAPQGASADSVVRTGAPVSDFSKFLPPLPTDVSWLTASAAMPPKTAALPEAGSVTALMFVPKPAEAWGPLTSQPVALRSSSECKRC